MDGMLGMIGDLYKTNAQLPLQYGGMYQNAYAPYFNYASQQAGNMSSLGQQNIGTTGQVGQGAMNLYGSLANTQAGMYQSELPFQMQSQMFNSLAPVLSGLLGQGGFGDLPGLSPISMKFNRPDVMSGFQPTVNQAYGNVGNAYNQSVQNTQSYDDKVGSVMADMMDKMPTAPYMQKPPMAAPPRPQSKPRPRPSPQALYSMANPGANPGYAQAVQSAFPKAGAYSGFGQAVPSALPKGGASFG